LADANAGIHARLAAYTDLTDLVSTRIWRVRAPDIQTLPYVVIHRISTTPNHVMGADTTPTEARIQISVYDDDGPGCDAAALEVKNALSRWSGTAGTVTFQHVFFEDENDQYDEDSNYFQKNLDFRVFYEE
jgi:hypothetical protein